MSLGQRSTAIWNSFCLYGSVASESSGTKQQKNTVAVTKGKPGGGGLGADDLADSLTTGRKTSIIISVPEKWVKKQQQKNATNNLADKASIPKVRKYIMQ